MNGSTHKELADFIWTIADKLRGPYRPPQYRKVMLPMIVLRRLDCVLEPTKKAVLDCYATLQNLDNAFNKNILSRIATGEDRETPLYNISKYTIATLLDDPDNLARNLIDYLNGFSEEARQIFEYFEFEDQIEKLDSNNILYLIIKDFAGVDLHPDTIDPHNMGTLFENLVRRFNEQANEEAGDHFTPREVIQLMTSILYTNEADIYKPGKVIKIYDPTCGTGGMLSVSEQYIKGPEGQNKNAHVELFGQEYNEESFAICRSDMLIKDEDIKNIVFGNTLGDSKTGDGHMGKRFNYMLANPPFGVAWEKEKNIVTKEHEDLGFDGRFGAGLPRINDGSFLFLQHMISKTELSPQEGGEGSRIAIVFNGSPLFTGDAGSGESNIRRWIIENDWLDAVIALPKDMFYNTGIFTYIWIVTNRKADTRKGKVQLIDATNHCIRLPKGIGSKRNLMTEQHIAEITRLYGNYTHNQTCSVTVKAKDKEEITTRICSKILANQDFGYLKITVERPLKRNFQASAERIEKLKEKAAFQNLATSKKRKNLTDIEAETIQGQKLQAAILTALSGIGDVLNKNHKAFDAVLNKAFKTHNLSLDAPLKKAILNALSERDDTAEPERDSKGHPLPDPELRDTENVPLSPDIPLPLPFDFDRKADNGKLLDLTRALIETYVKTEVLPHVPEAWVDFSKTKIGYEIPLNKEFYVYEPPRPLSEIEADIKKLEGEILDMLKVII